MSKHQTFFFFSFLKHGWQYSHPKRVWADNNDRLWRSDCKFFDFKQWTIVDFKVYFFSRVMIHFCSWALLMSILIIAQPPGVFFFIFFVVVCDTRLSKPQKFDWL